MTEPRQTVAGICAFLGTAFDERVYGPLRILRGLVTSRGGSGTVKFSSRYRQIRSAKAAKPI
jgi:hypothetical protein